MRSYQAARSYYSFLEFLSWCFIVFGVIVAIVAITAMSQVSRGFGGSSSLGIAGLIPGLMVSFMGLIGLILAQSGRAQVDCAEYAQQALQVSRDQLEISMRLFKQGNKKEQGYATKHAARDAITGQTSTAASFQSKPSDATTNPSNQHEIGSTIDYRGEEIRVVGAGYVLRDRVFSTYDQVTARIDATLPLQIDPPAQEAVKSTTPTLPTLGGAKRP